MMVTETSAGWKYPGVLPGLPLDDLEILLPVSGLDCCSRLVAGVERLEQHPTRRSHVSHRGVERILVRAGRSVEAADLADEL